MRGFWMLTWTEWKLYLRNPFAAFFTLIYPVMLIFLFGSIYGNEPRFAGFGTIDLSVPSYIVLIITTVGSLSLPIHLSTYRERRILRRLAVTPISPLALLGAEGLTLFAFTLSGTLLMIVAARLFYGLRFAGTITSVAVAFVLSCLALFSFGFLVASLCNSARMAQAVSFVIFFPMMFLSGAALPREILSENLRRISVIFPATPAVTLLRATWVGESLRTHLPALGGLLAVWIVSSVLASRLFRWE
ncbi:ABC transporter permease [Thermorudis peleae]|uniref:ABC transporter permease n=1 Tax=Thermorudis peleae TaxID=1382356 RepID=UPI00056E1146|nr:ABC transporter permease [Thermorudis peleae]